MPQVQRTLNVDAVVDAAAAIAHTDGVGSLTMKRIAAAVGVTPMALYRHVRTKEELLARLADRYLAEVDYAGVEQLPWQERIRVVFRGVRAVFTRHPDLASILSAQPVDGPAAYAGAEVVLQAMADAGIPDAAAASAFDTLRSFSAGCAVRETARLHPDAPLALGRLQHVSNLSSSDFPRVRALAGELIVSDADARFERGLDLLIAGLEQQAAP